ncbi:MAG TPA: phosphate ABC transporter ATP-binding protein PstB [bacterium]|mgnify:CR=1 FL=1|nr:phosphate ABC transporter ATP-binding protein [Dictyoglomota bacterium]HHV81894.1 phosphate ABC transporter ATP-binding protein [bacterium]HOK29184.1 phosphate ABC transporter ATP-binding protein PstB [bacterium]HOL54542.1 phosphate ABC transporter ATP-binding protein PstB [bacterium]HON72828.1 phosphate ABC transporter ATP-binding protein PstB [bacterium]
MNNKLKIKISVRNLNIYYGKFLAIKNITLDIPERSITAVIGPSGCGKSTFLRALNRMNELLPDVKTEGEVSIDGRNIYSPDVDLVKLRRNVGMVFQRPNPFPKSIFENVAFGLRIQGIRDRERIEETVELSLRRAALWDEVKDKLYKSALELSGGQQQRLCIARALAVQPQVILMDEPASALDPIATLRIEDLMRELKEEYTIVIVTHNMQQAARVSDFTAFFLTDEDRAGMLIEYGNTSDIFTMPKDPRTEGYITGRYG